MNVSVLNEKELLLMKDFEKENKKTLDEKMLDKLNKKRIQEKEGTKKDLLLSCENDLCDSIDRVFKKVINESETKETTLELTLLQYYKLETREACIAEFGKTVIEQNHLEKVYDKILKQVYNKWKNHVKYCKVQEEINQQQEAQDTKFERNVRTFFSVLKWICIIIFAPIVLLFMFIYICAKDR